MPDETQVPQPDFNVIAGEFNKDLIDVVQGYGQKLPIIYMIKIMQDLGTDLLLQQVGIQVQFRLERYDKENQDKKILTI